MFGRYFPQPENIFRCTQNCNENGACINSSNWTCHCDPNFRGENCNSEYILEPPPPWLPYIYILVGSGFGLVAAGVLTWRLVDYCIKKRKN
jgi:hypothetical protein